MDRATLKTKTIGVLMGGLSGEREISLRSGRNCLRALESCGYRAVAIDAVRDVAQRLDEEGVEVAFLAGMIAGFAALEELTGVKRRVLGIDASATLEKTRDQVTRIARHTAELIELGRELRDDEIQVLEGWAGELYGIPVDSTMEAMALGAQLEAMITDPVYEGKSLAGLIDLVRSGDISKDSTVLYAHLGGQPALNAYHSLWDPSA